MKNYLFLPALFFCSMLMGQSDGPKASTEKVIVNNDKMKVVEFVSIPNGNVCGEGMHHHEPHLTVVLTDAKVQVTTEEGEAQDLEVKAGTSIWFESETHSVINIGDEPAKMLLVYLKEQP